MPRPRNRVPRYTLHKSSGQARINLNGREIYLGKHGSPESLKEYARIVTELRAGPAAAIGADARTPITVDQVLREFWKYAQQHYRRADGSPTNEIVDYKYTLAPLRELYGSTPVAEFGPLALKAVRQRMIEAGWSRGVINQRIGKIKRAFKWATSEQLVPVEIHQALATVAGLQRGRTVAPEPEPVLPVDVRDVRRTLAHVRPAVAAMAELQLLTGMRPGEVVSMRPADVDTSGPIWLYSPAQHKTAHHGRRRVVSIGPRGQKLLRAFAPTFAGDYYFSPAREVVLWRAEKAAARKTPRYGTETARREQRRKAKPKRPPAAAYTTASYSRAIVRGVELANQDGGDLVQAWSPNQLRHTHATEVRRQFGLEAAQVVLGHSHARITEVYAERNGTLAATVAAAIG